MKTLGGKVLKAIAEGLRKLARLADRAAEGYDWHAPRIARRAIWLAEDIWDAALDAAVRAIICIIEDGPRAARKAADAAMDALTDASLAAALAVLLGAALACRKGRRMGRIMALALSAAGSAAGRAWCFREEILAEGRMAA